FTVKLLTWPSSVLPRFCDSAPGTSVAKLKSARPLFAMFFNVSLSSVNERSPLTDCSSTTRLVTLTSSVSPPTSSVNDPIESLSFALTTRFVRSSVLRSEEHTSELQSRGHLVCRLLLEKKKKI